MQYCADAAIYPLYERVYWFYSQWLQWRESKKCLISKGILTLEWIMEMEQYTSRTLILDTIIDKLVVFLGGFLLKCATQPHKMNVVYSWYDRPWIEQVKRWDEVLLRLLLFAGKPPWYDPGLAYTLHWDNEFLRLPALPTRAKLTSVTVCMDHAAQTSCLTCFHTTFLTGKKPLCYVWSCCD